MEEARAPRAAGDAVNLVTRYHFSDDDPVQKLPQGCRRRAAEEEEDEQAKKYVDRMCVPLLVPALTFVWVLFQFITRAPCWTSSGAQTTDEQHDRAVIFHLCSVLAFAEAVAAAAILCWYLLTAASAREAARTLAAVRFLFVVVVVLMATAICVGIDADWRVFLGAAAIAGVGVLYIFGKLERGVWARR